MEIDKAQDDMMVIRANKKKDIYEPSFNSGLFVLSLLF